VENRKSDIEVDLAAATAYRPRRKEESDIGSLGSQWPRRSVDEVPVPRPVDPDRDDRVTGTGERSDDGHSRDARNLMLGRTASEEK